MQNPINNREDVTIHLLILLCCTHLQPMADRHHMLLDKKGFYTGEVPRNAVKWAFFGTFWCLGGV